MPAHWASASDLQPLRGRRQRPADRRHRRPIVWGRRKAEAVQKFGLANDVELQHSYFYADGDEDVALMRVVGNPRPVNPRARLAAAAAEHGWPVLRVSKTAARSVAVLASG